MFYAIAAVRYLLYAVLTLIAVLLGWATCWLWPLFVKEDPKTKEGNLPRWLIWFQTHDAPLDEVWRNGLYLKNFKSFAGLTPDDFRKSRKLRWKARMFWLFRNPAYTFRAHILGWPQDGITKIHLRQKGSWEVDATSHELYFADNGGNFWTRAAWSYRAKWFYTKTRYVRINIGWKLVMPSYAMIAIHVNPFRSVK